MNKKLRLTLLLLVILSAVLTACNPTAAPAAKVDWNVTWNNFFTSMPADYYTIKSDALSAQLTAGSAPTIIDVREPAEIQKSGYIKGAINLPIRTLLQNLDKLPALDKPIVVYCTVGHRGAMAMASLRLLGYTNVRSLGGGLNAWLAAKFTVETGTPAAPVTGTAAAVDQARLTDLNAYLASLPDGFYGTKDTDALQVLNSSSAPVLIDVRTADEFSKSHIKNSVNVPITALLTNAAQLPANKATPILTICSAGHRGSIATMALRMLGYSSTSILGGTNAWTNDKLPTE